jgi:hypothetical protein
MANRGKLSEVAEGTLWTPSASTYSAYSISSTRPILSMVSAFRHQVGSLNGRGLFYVSRMVEMGDGWHTLCTDDVLELNCTLSRHDTNSYSSCRPRKGEMAAVTRRAVDTSPSSVAQTALAQSRKIKLLNDSQ